MKTLKIHNFCFECLIRVPFKASEIWEHVISFKIGFSTWKWIFFCVMVLKFIVMFMWWRGISLNTLWLLVMLYVDVIELYNICLMHDGKYWRCILTMVMGHCEWCCCCMYNILHSFMLLDKWPIVGEPKIPLCGLGRLLISEMMESASHYQRWW